MAEETSSNPWALQMKTSRRDNLWEEVQKKTFVGWMNMHLSKRSIRIQDLQKDLCDGVVLINLLEILNESKIEGRYYKNPKSKPYKIDNVNFALSFITDTLKIKLISCSAEDIVDGNVKIILGMLWRLIQRFELSQGNSRLALLQWCKETTKDATVNIENFQSSFEDGLAFCCLIQQYDNDLIDLQSLKAENKMQNLNLAFGLLEERLDIPQLLDASDISNGLVDERSVMTYLSMIHRAFLKKENGEPTRDLDTASSADLKVEVNSLHTDKDELNTKIKDLRKEISELKANQKAKTETEASLRSQLLEAEEKITKLTERQSELETQLKQATEALPKEDPKEVVEDPKDAAEEPKEDPKEVIEDPKDAAEEPKEEVKEESKEIIMQIDEPTVVEEESKEIVEEPKEEEPVEVKEDAPADATKGGEPVEAAKEGEEPVEAAKEEEKPVEATKEDAEVLSRQSATETEKTVVELQNGIVAAHEKLVEQEKETETLRKTLEETTEEMQIIQRRQKRAQDKAVKKTKQKYEKKVQRREKEIETLKKERAADIQQKDAEIESIKKQLKIAQNALGANSKEAPEETSNNVVEEDIALLKSELEELGLIVQGFEEEEKVMSEKKQTRTDEDKEEDEVSETEV